MANVFRDFVLVFDRNVDWARQVMAALRPAGYRVDWTSDLGTAIEWLEETQHVLAIVGTEVDALDAADVVARLRTRRPDLRVLLATADLGMDDEREAELAGAFPVPRDLGRRALRTVVDACVARTA
jgi:DNA-binding response OmpR family regulator